MITTILCIAVVVVSIVAVGIPFRWLLHGRSPLGEQEWIEAPFLGIAAIILVLQNLVYLDLPLRYTTPLLWAITLAGWVWMYRTGQLSASLATAPLDLLGTALIVYLLQGIGLILVGARSYMGRAWGDQYNYTVLAQFLADERFSTSMGEVGNRPYLVNAIAFKSDRIGQSVLHGFFATSSLQEAKTLFEPTILLAPALIVLVIFALGRRCGLSRRYALTTSATAGLLPAVAAIHLESFLSQALAVPLLLLYPVLLDALIEQINWRRLCVCAIITAALTSVYTEFWIILLGLVCLVLGTAAVRSPQARRLFGCWCALALAPFVLNPAFTPTVLQIFTRVGESALGDIYPWALTIEGISRVWLGDLAGAPAVFQSATRLYAVAATMLGYYGLMHICLSLISAGRATWTNLERRQNLAFALGLLALALLPVAVIVRDSQHPYQFYKLLLSISPLLVLGLALACFPYLPNTTSLQISPAALSPSILALLLMGITLAGSIAGTTTMAVQSTSLQPAERYAGHFLLAPDMRQLQERLEALHGNKLFFYQTDTTWDTGFLNAWLAYFARHNQIWLGNAHLNGNDLSTTPETRSILDLNTLPPDALVLNNVNTETAAFVRAPPPQWSTPSYQLWKPSTPYWLIPLKLENKNGVEQLGGETFLWMGQGDTIVEILASKPGVLSLNATFAIGPSAPGTSERTLLLSTSANYRQHVTITEKSRFILAPVKAGINTITLRVLDRPSISQQPNGDSRPLMLGVKGLNLRLSETPTAIAEIENPNGIEAVDGQPFFWLGQGNTTLKVLIAATGQLRMTATFSLGPSAPELSDRRVQVTTDRGYRQTFILRNGVQSIVLPVESGVTTITLHTLDRPSLATQPNGDTRPLLLGVQGLQVELEK